MGVEKRKMGVEKRKMDVEESYKRERKKDATS